MNLCSRVRRALRDPRKAILFMTLGPRLYCEVMSLRSTVISSKTELSNPLEMHMLKVTDINHHLVTLYMLTVELGLRSVLELGVRTGESTIALLLAARDIGGRVTSIDIADSPQAASEVNSLGLAPYWHFIKGDDLVVSWNAPIDLLFIDTSHTYQHTLQELAKFEPFVRVGGVLVLHDVVTYPDVLHAVRHYIGGRPDFRLYKYFNNNGLAVIFKRSTEREAKCPLMSGA